VSRLILSFSLLSLLPLAAEKLTRIQSPAITEASGLAVSTANPELLWTHNDSGGTPQVHLIGSDGSAHGQVTVSGCVNTDWEDLASFTLAGKNYLLIADTGDNAAKRSSVSLIIIPEPNLPATGKPLEATVDPAWQIHFTYPGGPRDCESVAVDVQAGKILLISKRTKPPEVYELPLKPATTEAPLSAVLLGNTAVVSPTLPFMPYGNQPTGFDISADGQVAAVITYSEIFLFPRQPEETWASVFARPPIALPAHHLKQAEAVALAKNGEAVFALSEGKSSPIIRLPVSQRPGTSP
jgi:hypothetical protein